MFVWAKALVSKANAAQAPNLLSHRDALNLEVRGVPSAGQYLDTIRLTRLALLPD